MGSSRQPALSWDYPRTSPPSIGINRAGHIVREVGRQELDHPDTILDDSERCRRDLCWNLIGAVSDRMRIRGQAARSIGLSASFWVRLGHPSTLRIVI